jgi:hypothetical protein
MALDAPQCLPMLSCPRLPAAKTGVGGIILTEATERSPEAVKDRDRIVNLSDGVFAIAITLLVLDIRVPDILEGMVATELPAALLSLWPKYFGYVLSFVVISTL